MGTTNARTNTRWLIGVFGAGVFALGCGHAASAPRTGARVPSEGQRHRLDFRVNAHLPACDDRDSFREQLAPEVQDVIAPDGERVLRVAIDRYHENEKRIFVELVDEKEQVIDRVDHAVGGTHMDCGRVLRLAARFASAMVDNEFLHSNAAAAAPEQSPVLHDRRLADKPRKAEPRKHEEHEEDAEEDEADDTREEERRVDKPRHKGRRRGWNDERHESEPEPMRRDYRGTRPDPEVICPPVPNSAPSQPITVQPVNNVYIGGKEPKGEEADPFAGGHFMFGFGALRGPDSRLNIAGRFGGTYVTSSGKYAFEFDATGSGALPGVANNSNPSLDYSTFLLSINMGLCGRSSSLGICILGSGMLDGYKPTTANAALWNGYAWGAGTRAWVDIYSGDTWALRANFEMTLPVMITDEKSKDPRILAPFVPVGALLLTVVLPKKSDAGKDKGDEKKK